MRLILVGCEYSGTTTLAEAISEWAKEVMGGGFGFHDHWKIPHVSHPPGLTAEEQEQFMALSPNLKEMFQRYHIEYHLSPSFYGDPHHNSVASTSMRLSTLRSITATADLESTETVRGRPAGRRRTSWKSRPTRCWCW